MADAKRAAIVLVLQATRGPHARILVVTNRRYGGVCLPGGKVDAHETPKGAAVRELQEETGLDVVARKLVFLFAAPSVVEPDREVSVYLVREVLGRVVDEAEPGTHASWTTFPELSASHPFGEFYARHFPDGIGHLASTSFR